MPPLASPAARAHSFRRARPLRAKPSRPPRSRLHVEVAWSAPSAGTPHSSAARVELEVEAKPHGQPAWTCREPSGTGWEEALSAAGCEEVVLTAQLTDDADARHLVLGLAERLTQQLAATKPLIRVRFLVATSHGA